MANEKYAFLIAIDDTDIAGPIVQLIKGVGSVLDLIEGRDQETAGNESWFNRYVLKPSLLPVGTPEIRCMCRIAWNTNVPKVLQNQIDSSPGFWAFLEMGASGGPYTRARMFEILRGISESTDVCSHHWDIAPGDNLTGDLLAHFTAFPWWLNQQQQQLAKVTK